VHAGTFSRDLFYRLSEFTLKIPPLRERQQDIIHIAKRILSATNNELGKKVRGLSEPALKVLQGHSWPGNVRQLRSAIRRAVLHAQDWIVPEHLVLEDSASPDADSASNEAEFDWIGLPLKEMVRRKTAELERQAIVEALRRTGGNKAKAARLLQIDYTTIHAKLKQYGIRSDADEAGAEKEK
jgi:two-component system nitrogen regulation response regulator GlnG